MDVIWDDGSIPAIQASGRFALLSIEPVGDFDGIRLRLLTSLSSAGVPGRVKDVQQVEVPPAELDGRLPVWLWGLPSGELGGTFKVTNDGGGRRSAFKSSSPARTLLMW